MTIENEGAAPAGESEGGISPMSMEAAVSFLDKLDAGDSEETKKPTASDGEVVETPEIPQEDEQPEETEVEEGAEAPEADEGEPEADYVSLDALKPESKLRLRDGTEFTIAEVKKNWDALRNVQKREQEIQTKESEITQRSTQAAQHEQIFSRLAPMAYHVLQSQLPQEPPRPTAELAASDPMAYLATQAAHNDWQRETGAKMEQMRQLQAAENHRVNQAREAEQRETDRRLAEGNKELLKAIPELKDPAYQQKFFVDILATGKHYGFNEEEVKTVHDPRVVRLISDAMKYRKLQSKPPQTTQATKPAQGKTAPVVAPGRRVSAAESSNQSRNDLQRKANAAAQKGDLQTAAKLYSQLEG